MTIALDIFRALADSTRLRILALLRSMELSVGELAQVLGQSQPRVSRHVKILCDAGLAERRKEGSWVFVAPGRRDRIDPIVAALDAWDRLEPDHWAVADAARLAAVRADRASAAQSWFAQHAAEWDAIRSLHVAEAEVEGAIGRALDGRPIGRLVDIGTGTGRMLELLGPRAESAIGIDCFARRSVNPADFGNLAVCHREVGGIGARASPIHDTTPANDQIMHVILLLGQVMHIVRRYGCAV